ncbi:hypothetical protein DFQ30_003300 [Apophysomyces sp. BC1015]|nr:hypothetical protein DFQ30_003300 [Apophysomyces sp. BC1015]
MENKTVGSLPGDILRNVAGHHLLQSVDTMKDLHARAFRNTRDSKQRTSDAKSGMDERQVGLQNVMYEERHLLDEIVRCRDFRSVFQDIDLVPYDEFCLRAPQEYLLNKENPHTLMINRLKFEYEERSRLKDQQEKLQAERLLLIKENRKAQEKLDRFDKLLDDLVQATEPVEKALLEASNHC